MTGKVCVKCQVELRPKRNGVGAVSMADFGPYEIYDADLWECPSCKIELLLGFGRGPVREHFQDDFVEVVKRYEPYTVQFWEGPEAKSRAVQS